MEGFNIIDILPIVVAFMGGNLWQVLSYRRKARQEKQDILQKMSDELESLYSTMIELRQKIWDMEQVNVNLKQEVIQLVNERDGFKREAEKLKAELEKHIQEAKRLRDQVRALKSKGGKN